jgi:hypothetical protein
MHEIFNNELDILFPQISESESENEGVLMKLSTFAQFGMSVVGALSLIYTVATAINPEIFGRGPLKGMDPVDASYLSQVRRYCFNPIPLLNDADTCRVWSGKYVRLVSGLEKPNEDISSRIRDEIAMSIGGLPVSPQSNGSLGQ